MTMQQATIFMWNIVCHSFDLILGLMLNLPRPNLIAGSILWWCANVANQLTARTDTSWVRCHLYHNFCGYKFSRLVTHVLASGTAKIWVNVKNCVQREMTISAICSSLRPRTFVEMIASALGLVPPSGSCIWAYVSLVPRGLKRGLSMRLCLRWKAWAIAVKDTLAERLLLELGWLDSLK